VVKVGLGRTLLGGLVAAALLLGVPAGASAAVESAQLGSTAAQFSYDQSGSGVFQFSNLRVKILRNGVAFVDQPPAGYPSFPAGAGLEGVGPAYGGQAPSVHVLQLDSTPDPEIVVDLFTGGAHCCFYSQIFSFSPGGNVYTSIVQDWLDQGYMFKDLDGDGISEFSSRDGRFAYAFGSFAASAFPPQIFKFSNGQMLDVTRQFPAIIRNDLGRQKRQWKKVRTKFDARPPLAAYTADQCLLGTCSKGFNLVNKSIKRGDKFVGGPGKFPGKLRKFLRKEGYL